jgi:hypothetical protein
MRLSGRFEPSQLGLEFEAQLRALVLSDQLILLVVAEERAGGGTRFLATDGFRIDCITCEISPRREAGTR